MANVVLLTRGEKQPIMLKLHEHTTKSLEKAIFELVGYYRVKKSTLQVGEHSVWAFSASFTADENNQLLGPLYENQTGTKIMNRLREGSDVYYGNVVLVGPSFKPLEMELSLLLIKQCYCSLYQN